MALSIHVNGETGMILVLMGMKILDGDKFERSIPTPVLPNRRPF